MRKFPVGVLKLPSLVPIPKRELEIGYDRRVSPSRVKVSCWSRIEMSIVVRGLCIVKDRPYNSPSVKKEYHIAIAGATGAVGAELLRVLERRNFPVATIRALASGKSAGKNVYFRKQPCPVGELNDNSFDQIDIAFFCAGGERSLKFVPIARDAGAVVIDNSSTFRMDP